MRLKIRQNIKSNGSVALHTVSFIYAAYLAYYSITPESGWGGLGTDSTPYCYKLYLLLLSLCWSWWSWVITWPCKWAAHTLYNGPEDKAGWIQRAGCMTRVKDLRTVSSISYIIYVCPFESISITFFTYNLLILSKTTFQ